MRDTDTALVRCCRFISSTARVLVEENESVMPDTPIAKTEVVPGKLWLIDVAARLKIRAADVSERMVVGPTEKVPAGGIIAVGGSFFHRCVVHSPVNGTVALVSRTRGIVYVREDVETGSQEESIEVPVARVLGISPLMLMVYKTDNTSVGAHTIKEQVIARFGRKMATSPIYGKITAISPVRGTVTIEPLFRSQVTLAYLKGRVGKVMPGKAVEVWGKARVVNGIWGLGRESCGRLHVLDGDLAEDAELHRDSVIVARGTATYAGLLHAAESGVKGVILGWLSVATAIRFASGLKNMGVTGDESTPFPVVLMEGFLNHRIRDESFGAFKVAAGSLCSVRGMTHIRAGVVRPEILIFPE